MAQWAGTDPTGKCALEFAENGVQRQSCPAAFGSVSRRMVRNRWAAVTFGGVVVPAQPGTTFEMVQSETGFQLPVVVLDAPADLRQPYQLGQRGVGGEGGEPVVGGFIRSGRPLGEQPHRGQGAVLGAGMSRFAGRTRNTANRECIDAVGLVGSVLLPRRQVTVRRDLRPAARTRSLQVACGP